MTDASQQPEPSGPAGARADEIARVWTSGWQRFVFPSVWMAYLVETGFGVHAHAAGAAAVFGYVVIGLFAACYIRALPITWTERSPVFWRLYSAALVLTVVECFIAQDSAFVFLVYLAVLTVASRARWTWPVILGYVLIGTFLPPLVPSWRMGIDWATGVTVLLVPFAMWGFFHIIESNRALAQARAEVARLAAEGERTRIARDLHDLLGHSLTTITVKAGLARRLSERGEAERALTEIGEVEELSRRTLGDVRAAVSAHREVTLAGELATAREVLRASGIVAELPPSVVETDPALSELFGWIVREGVTNVVRHSRATRVRITAGRTTIEIADDGRGCPAVSSGNGLCGLRERVAAAGGELEVDGDGGFRLRVDVVATTSTPPGVRTRRADEPARPATAASPSPSPAS